MSTLKASQTTIAVGCGLAAAMIVEAIFIKMLLSLDAPPSGVFGPLQAFVGVTITSLFLGAAVFCGVLFFQSLCRAAMSFQGGLAELLARYLYITCLFAGVGSCTLIVSSTLVLLNKGYLLTTLLPH